MSIISIYGKIDSLLNIPGYYNPIHRMRIHLFATLVLLIIPFGIINGAAARILLGTPLVLNYLAVPAAIALLALLRAGAPIKPLALFYGLLMEFLFLEELLFAGSSITLLWLAAVPFIVVFVAGASVGALMLAVPVLIVGIDGFNLFYPFRTGLTNLQPMDLGAYTIFFLTLFGTAVIFNRLAFELYRNYLAKRAALRRSVAAIKDRNARLAEELKIREVLFETIPVPAFIKDRNLRYTGCTNAYFELTGLTREQVVGKEALDIFLPEEAASYSAADRQLSEAGGTQCLTTSLTRPSGQTRQIFVNKMALMDEDGSFGGIVGVILDETDRIKKEQELQNLLDGRRDALALVGHDLRGPMGSFKDFLESLAAEGDVTPESYRFIVGELSRKVSSLYGLMTELVEWAHLEQGLSDFRPADNCVADLEKEIHNLYEAQAAKKGVDFRVESPADPEGNPRVYGDRRMIAAVLRNLVANALKFTPRGGSVVLRFERHEAQGDGAGPRGWTAIVEDTGVGMEETQIRALMTGGDLRSRRGTEGEPGTGLGLKLCRRLMERHGGLLRIDSTPNKGTVFSVLFPDKP